MPDHQRAAANGANSLHRILIVDDDVSTRLLYRFLFTSNGYLVTEATDGLHALEQLEAQWFPVVVTDLNMPHMDGMELVRAIRGSYPGIYVIMITAFGSIDTGKCALRAGADEYLAKPFDFEDLEHRVNRFFLAQQRAS